MKYAVYHITDGTQNKINGEVGFGGVYCLTLIYLIIVVILGSGSGVAE